MSEFTAEQAAALARFEAAAPAPESFDATAALRRVLALAAKHEDCCGYVTSTLLRKAIEQS
jgi:hypothetical protein